MEEENIIKTNKEDFEGEVKQESKVYRFDEMIDEMEQSILNVQNIHDEQTHLVQTLEELNKPEFEDLIKSMKEQLTDMEEQLTIMTDRKNTLKEVMEISKNNEIVTEILEKIIIALGLFKE